MQDTCRMYSNNKHAVLLTSPVIVAWQDIRHITPVAGVLHNSQPAAACIVEFAGGPGSWVARTYTATKGGGAFFNGQRLETSSTSAINQSLLVGNGAPVRTVPFDSAHLALKTLHLSAHKMPCELPPCMQMLHVFRR